MCVFEGTDQKILEFLNSGGSPKAAVSRLRTADNGEYNAYTYQDVTGDGIPELIFVDFGLQKQLHILHCSDGQYQEFSLKTVPFDYDPAVIKPIVDDLNQNNLREILVYQGEGISCCKIFALEWNGTAFENLIPNGYTQIPVIIKDVDGNSTKEIISGINTETYPVGLNRFESIVFSWNGSTYEISKESFSFPIFCIQAVYDGDWEARNHNFEKALYLYQKAIDDLTLESWSEARSLYEQKKWESFSNLTSEPTPPSDPSEYPRLAAYAYYRIMLLYFAQEQKSDAESTYKTLQQKFGNDPYGQPYADIATAFWDSYQSTHKMYDGCAAAIHYAVEHPEILTPLGSDYHGSQSHTYVPADICPFR